MDVVVDWKTRVCWTMGRVKVRNFRATGMVNYKYEVATWRRLNAVIYVRVCDLYNCTSCDGISTNLLTTFDT